MPGRFEAQHVIHTLRREGVRGWVPLLEGVDGTVGLLTTNSSKEVMCVACQELLADNRLLVSRALLSVTFPPKEILEQLAAELRSYMVYVDPPKTLFGKVRAGRGPCSAIARLLRRRSRFVRSRGAPSRARWAATTTTW